VNAFLKFSIVICDQIERCRSLRSFEKVVDYLRKSNKNNFWQSIHFKRIWRMLSTKRNRTFIDYS